MLIDAAALKYENEMLIACSSNPKAISTSIYLRQFITNKFVDGNRLTFALISHSAISHYG